MSQSRPLERPTTAAILQVAAILLGVFLFTRFGGLFSLPPSGISAFWPANALLLSGVLLLAARPARITLFLALPTYFLAELWVGYPPLHAAVYSAANVAEVAAFLWLVGRRANPVPTFNTIKDLFRFLAFAMVVSPIGGGIGALASTWDGGDFTGALLRWTLADFFGYCLLVPLVLGGRTWQKYFSFDQGTRRIEFAVLMTALLLAAALSSGALGFALPMGAQFLAIPILLWAALRFGPPGGAFATVIVACVAFYAAVQGVGPFATGSPDENVASLQLFFASLVISVMAIASVNAERRETVAALRRSEGRYRIMFENSPIPIWEEDFSAVRTIFDRLRNEGVTYLAAYFDEHPEVIRQCAEQARILDVNQAALDLHRAGSKEELLAGLVNTFTPESFNTFRDELLCLWRGETTMTRDAVVKTLDGELRHVSVNFTVSPGHEQTLARVYVSLIDITARIQAESALITSAQHFRSLAESSPDNIVRYDRQCRLVYLNHTMRETIEIAPALALGKTPTELGFGGANISAEYEDHIRRAVEKGEESAMELTIPSLNGERRTHHVRFAPEYDEQGGITGALAIGRDISDRMHMEEQLRTSEQRFHAIFDQSFQFIGLLATDGTLLEANHAALELAGAKEADVIGKPFWDSPWWRHDTMLQQQLRDAVREAASGKTIRFEATHLDQNGDIHFIDFSLKPVIDSSGRVVQLIPEGRDITERKQAEQERQSHATFLASMDRINRAIQGTGDLDAMMGDVLDEVLDIFDCDRAFLLYPCDPESPTWSVPMERTRPEYPGALALGTEVPMAAGTAAKMQQVLEAPGVVKFDAVPDEIAERFSVKSMMSMAIAPKLAKPWEFGIQQCSYERRWTADEEHLLEEIGRRLGDALSTLLMLRNLRESEARYRRIVDTAREGILILDENESVTFVNAYMANMIGHTPDDLKCHQMTDFMLDVDHADHRQKLFRRRQNIAETYERRLIRKDGSLLWVLVSAAPVFEGDRYRGALAMVTDITELKQKEDKLTRYRDHLEEEVQQRTEELRLARDAAEAASKAKSIFLANMSHELRTPLNAILGFSQIMSTEAGLTPAQRENLEIINRSGEHLLGLINDVLEIAKIEAGKLQLDVSSFDLHDMVLNVADMMRLRAQQKGLQLQLEQAAEVPRHIRGDASRLRQILVNLVSNAVKFTDRGAVTIRLGIKDNARQHLCIEIEDSGPGISATDRERLFQPFVQLADGVSRGGTGLGLAIVNQYVQLMDGSIHLESTPGRGTLFRIEIPLERADDVTSVGGGEIRRGDVAGLAPGQRTYRILIAEDQRETLLLLAKLMSDIGMEVRTARDGAECVHVFEVWQPALILMDRRMPVMDGIEATRRIRQLPGGDKVKIVAVTASVFKEQLAELREAGIDGLVSKPFRINDIYDALAEQLGLTYIYRDSSAVTRPAAVLTPHDLDALEPAQRDALRAALESLEVERITAAIRHIGEQYPDLGDALRHLADNFDYPTILRTLSDATVPGNEGEAPP